MTLRQLIVSALLLTSAAMSHAIEFQPYSAAALAAAQKADKPVALQFHADWCPTCRAQDKVLDKLKAEPGLDVTVFKVNYDTEKDLKRQYKIQTQSTVVVLRGDKERGRLVGDTTEAGIRAALKSAL
jgi:thiol-disulfide isomerase/thioredoxin